MDDHGLRFTGHGVLFFVFSVYCGMQILPRDLVARLYPSHSLFSSDWFFQVYSRMITNVSTLRYDVSVHLSQS